MSPKEWTIQKLKECQTNDDTEASHSKADQILLDYISDPDITAEYKKINKWYA